MKLAESLKNCDFQTVKNLMNQGADVNYLYKGWVWDEGCSKVLSGYLTGYIATGHLTLLHIETWKNRVENVRFLLLMGANKEIKDSMGRTPLDMALKIEAPQEIVDLLQAKSDWLTSLATVMTNSRIDMSGKKL